MNRSIDVATAWGVSIARLGNGLMVGKKLGARPAKRLVVYEFEGCPFCRKVREALTILDLEAEVRPCPKGSKRFREELLKKGGKQQFPYLEDPNTGAAMYESNDIISYLYKQYGAGTPPRVLWSAPFTYLSAPFAALMRPAGSSSIAAKPPEKLLELYSFEASPYCRIAREALCKLELPYILHNVGKGSPSREAFVKISGKMMVPFLIDPNTNTQMFESGDIKSYLYTTYRA